MAATNAATVAMYRAIPPNVGVGARWTFRLIGTSNHPRRTTIARKRGVTTSAVAAPTAATTRYDGFTGVGRRCAPSGLPAGGLGPRCAPLRRTRGGLRLRHLRLRGPGEQGDHVAGERVDGIGERGPRLVPLAVRLDQVEVLGTDAAPESVVGARPLADRVRLDD